MILLTLIILILALIVFFKTKKIKELNKNLLKREAVFILLYEQRFEYFLKLINITPIKIQESIYMDIGELRKESLFIKLQSENSKYFAVEEKIQLIFKKIKKNVNTENQSNFIEVNNHIGSLNTLIDETKSEYNNLIDDFNQETSDFFGKKISKHMKGLKKFNHM